MKKLLLLGLLVFIMGCAQQPLSQPVSSTYESAEFGFSMDYPEDWIVAEAPEVGVSFLGPYDYLANIVVSVEEFSGTLDEYWDMESERLDRSEIMIGTTYTDSLIVVNGKDSIKLDLEYTLGENVDSEVYYFVDGTYVYSIVYQTYEGYFDEHYNEFEESLATFSF